MLYNIICNMCVSIISTVIIRWHTLLSVQLQCRSCPSSSIPRSFLTPLLSFCHSDMQWLAPPIQPLAHPEVELVQPTSVDPSSAGIGSIAVAKWMGQCGHAVSSHKARHHWHTTQHVLSPAQIKARRCGRLGLLCGMLLGSACSSMAIYCLWAACAVTCYYIS
jgi:hypothetical protein